MNRTRVRPQNGPNLGAKRSRGGAPASICNDEWARFGALPSGPGQPRALGGVTPLARANARAAQRAYPSTLGCPGAGAIHIVYTL